MRYSKANVPEAGSTLPKTDVEDSPVVVMVAVPSAVVGRAIAVALLESRLAACVQAMPIASTYRWQGKIESEEEVLLLIKTRAGVFEALEATIVEHHPYEVPELISVPAGQVHRGYFDWLLAETQPE